MTAPEGLVWAVTQEDIDIDMEAKEAGHLVAHLLINEVIFAGSGGFFARPGHEVTLHVICSDTFGYACADCEDLPYAEVGALYRLWRKDPHVRSYCLGHIQAQQRPIEPAVRWLTERGYDVDALIRGELPCSS